VELIRRVVFAVSCVAGAALVLSHAPIELRAQGRCMLTPGTPACNTTTIAPVFAPTGWKTVALEQITFVVGEHQPEAMFYAALMGWTARNVNEQRAVMEIGDWGSVIFKKGTSRSAVVESFGFVIEPWNALTVEAELKKRGLEPVADNDGHGNPAIAVNVAALDDADLAELEGTIRYIDGLNDQFDRVPEHAEAL